MFLKSRQKTSEQVHFLVKLKAAGMQLPNIWNLHRCFSKILLKLLLFVWTNSKKPFRSKIKIIYVNNSLHVCVREDKKNYSGECFQPVRYRDYENLSNQKTPLEYKVLNAYSIYFTPILKLARGRKVACSCNETVRR